MAGKKRNKVPSSAQTGTLSSSSLSSGPVPLTTPSSSSASSIPATTATATATTATATNHRQNASAAGTPGWPASQRPRQRQSKPSSSSSNKNSRQTREGDAARFLQSLKDPTANETTQCTITNAHVFKLPPNTQRKGASWKEKVWQGTVKVVTRNNLGVVLLVDRARGSIFAVCPLSHADAVDRCTDSSRYFVLRIENAKNRYMFIGVAFNERSDSLDFCAALEESDRTRRENEISAAATAAADALMASLNETVGGELDIGYASGVGALVPPGTVPPTNGTLQDVPPAVKPSTSASKRSERRKPSSGSSSRFRQSRRDSTAVREAEAARSVVDPNTQSASLQSYLDVDFGGTNFFQPPGDPFLVNNPGRSIANTDNHRNDIAHNNNTTINISNNNNVGSSGKKRPAFDPAQYKKESKR